MNGLRHLGKQQFRDALRVLPMSVADLVGEAVEDEALRGVLGVRGIRYAAMGPRSAGTALNFLWDSAAGGGAAGRTVFARGGPDSLVEALVASAQSNGATIRCDADVAAIRTGRGSVHGVALASGEEIDARIVVSNADPKQTLLSLVDPAEVGPTLGWRVEHIRTPGVVAKVDPRPGGLPAFGRVDDERLRGRIAIAPSLDDLERAFDDSKYGRISEHPYLEATIPTLSDPSLAPDGIHVITALLQYAPRRLTDADWDETARDEVLRTWPCGRSKTTHRVSRTRSSLATSLRRQTSSESTASLAGTRCTASMPSTSSSPGGPSSDMLATGLPGSAASTCVGPAHIPGAESQAAPEGTQPGLSWPTSGELDAAGRYVAHAVRTRSGRPDEIAGAKLRRCGWLDGGATACGGRSGCRGK